MGSLEIPTHAGRSAEAAVGIASDCQFCDRFRGQMTRNTDSNRGLISIGSRTCADHKIRACFNLRNTDCGECGGCTRVRLIFVVINLVFQVSEFIVGVVLRLLQRLCIT